MESIKREEIKVKPNAGESESDYMHRCVPAMMDEGKEQEQAVAMCMNMFQEGKRQDEAEKKEKEWQDKFDKPLREGKACKPSDDERKKPKK